jgi:ubiquinone/menaquinone biosynthesis C-methylase UbiE
VAGAGGARSWFFDAWSRLYDLAPVQRLTYRPVHDAVLRALRARPPGSLLDLGCGTGILARRLRDELPQTRVVGCDFSAGMLARAAPRGGDVGWVRGDALRLPFRDEAFEAVVSTEAFHWFPDQSVALAECFRVVSPGGRLLVALVNPPVAAVGAAAHLFSRLAGQPLRWPTRGRMRALVEAAGFRVATQRRVWRVPPGVLLPAVLTVAVRPAAGRG